MSVCSYNDCEDCVHSGCFWGRSLMSFYPTCLAKEKVNGQFSYLISPLNKELCPIEVVEESSFWEIMGVIGTWGILILALVALCFRCVRGISSRTRHAYLNHPSASTQALGFGNPSYSSMEEFMNANRPNHNNGFLETVHDINGGRLLFRANFTSRGNEYFSYNYYS